MPTSAAPRARRGVGRGGGGVGCPGGAARPPGGRSRLAAPARLLVGTDAVQHVLVDERDVDPPAGATGSPGQAHELMAEVPLPGPRVTLAMTSEHAGQVALCARDQLGAPAVVHA